MPVSNIPGYFYDEAKNRYFKIMPTGPYSLAELTKAEQQKNPPPQQPHRQSRQELSNTNAVRFLTQRATMPFTDPKQLLSCAAQIILKRIKLNTILSIPFLPAAPVNSTCVAFAPNGTAALGFSSGMIDIVGYQCDPFLMWCKRSPFMNPVCTLSSLHCPKHLGSALQHSIVGTTLGSGRKRDPATVFRFQLPPSEALTNDDYNAVLESALSESSPDGPVRSHIVLLPNESMLDAITSRRTSKNDTEMYFTAFAADEHDMVIVGGEKGLHCFNSDLRDKWFFRTRSPVLTTHSPEGQPSLIWAGHRDGSIGLYDHRCMASGRTPSVVFRQQTAINRVMSLDAIRSMEVLTADALGLMAIWDARYCRTSSMSKKNGAVNRPVRTLEGQVEKTTCKPVFDILPQMNAVIAAGGDNRIRMWSLLPDQNVSSSGPNNEPFWTSQPFQSLHGIWTIPQPPPPATERSPFPSTVDIYSRNGNPGIIVGESGDNNRPTLNWLTI